MGNWSGANTQSKTYKKTQETQKKILWKVLHRKQVFITKIM